MKKILIAIIFLLMCGSIFSSTLPSVTLAWDVVDHPDLRGYNIYYRHHTNEPYQGTRVYEVLEEDLGNPLFPEITIFGLSYSTHYYFVATAFTDNQESGYSNEVDLVTRDEAKPEPTPDDNNGSGGGGGCFIGSVQ